MTLASKLPIKPVVLNEQQAENEKVLLVIDNNAADLSLIHRLVKTKKHSLLFRVVESTSCKKASKLLRSAKPSCCLISYQQPMDEVLDFLKSLRRSKLHENIPVIILADKGEGDARCAVEMMHHGAQDYLVRDELTENLLRRSITSAIYTCDFQKNLRQLAHYDQLTGLLNRNLFLDRLDNTLKNCDRYQQGCSLLYVDVDNFKVVNDCYGHDAGDILLQTIAERIKFNCRSTDSTARLGGDEFAILISQVDKATANQTAEKILEKVSEPVLINAQKLHVSLSIGVAHYPDTAANINELMEQADQAMYRVKQTGKARYFQFSQNQKLQWERRSRLEAMLPQAINDNELNIVFQPIFNTSDNSLYSIGVMSAWSPGRYKVSTDEIKIMVERLSLFEAYYQWMINEALKQYRLFDEFSLNLPIDYCANEVLVDYLRDALKRYEISPERVEIDITEKTIMTDIAQSRKILKLLKKLGVRITIDDFGGGYSSVDDLVTLPLDNLKIGPCCYAGAETNVQKYKTTEAVTLLGHALGLKVIAKDIDHKEQYQLIKTIGCDYLQGAYLSEAYDSLSDYQQYMLLSPCISSAIQS
ncbi:MAG: diguanylate cyclase domain-containing protein [Cellvibrionaceae bacterium]